MGKRRKTSGHRLAKALLATAAAGSILLYIGAKAISVPYYTVTRVFDGDTFETKEKQYIRLSGIDAPEMGRCGSQEAKQELEKLVVGKKLYIKVLYHTGHRLNGLVYNDKGLVNAAMLASGWAIMNDRDNVDIPELATATTLARKKSIGIFDSHCTQITNTAHPSCTIKGNVLSDGTKTYHTPDCQVYKLTVVQLYAGDQWFCNEQEAQKEGFTKAKQCAK